MVLPASVEADRLTRFTAAAAALQDAQVAARREAAEVLIGVADEWLADASVPRKQRLRQAQAAINALCMYIRSPFRLAKRYQRLTHGTVRRSWSAQKKRRLQASLEAFRAEAHLRGGILRAIAARLRTPDTVAPVSGGKTPQQHGGAPGSWSALTYDFSGAVFFYPVDFSGAYWGRRAVFEGCVFYGSADFSGGFFRRKARFAGCAWRGEVSFERCMFNRVADFSQGHYKGRLTGVFAPMLMRRGFTAQRIRIRLIIVAASTVGGPVLPITRTVLMRCLATASTAGMLCFRGPGTVAGRRWITAPMRGRRSCGSACMSGTPI
ncbi:hypothetical protein RA11412_0957 [Rothia aeria]|uniref:Pentapeptide repeat-containing protein n=1 Tax=Rothia aeria TaxID=172042 RepID=A0A2Z5QY48_9MICC|nr:hypothetical protein RA11412_0957 [Rothia aeria]